MLKFAWLPPLGVPPSSLYKQAAAAVAARRVRRQAAPDRQHSAAARLDAGHGTCHLRRHQHAQVRWAGCSCWGAALLAMPAMALQDACNHGRLLLFALASCTLRWSSFTPHPPPSLLQHAAGGVAAAHGDRGARAAPRVAALVLAAGAGGSQVRAVRREVDFGRAAHGAAAARTAPLPHQEHAGRGREAEAEKGRQGARRPLTWAAALLLHAPIQSAHSSPASPTP